MTAVYVYPIDAVKEETKSGASNLHKRNARRLEVLNSVSADGLSSETRKTLGVD